MKVDCSIIEESESTGTVVLSTKVVEQSVHPPYKSSIVLQGRYGWWRRDERRGVDSTMHSACSTWQACRTLRAWHGTWCCHHPVEYGRQPCGTLDLLICGEPSIWIILLWGFPLRSKIWFIGLLFSITSLWSCQCFFVLAVSFVISLPFLLYPAVYLYPVWIHWVYLCPLWFLLNTVLNLIF